MNKVDTDNFIHKLSAEGARKPLPRLHVQLAIWAAATISWLAALLCFKGLRPDFADKLSQPVYIAELLLLVCVGLSAALSALALSRPDGLQMPRLRLVPFGFVAAWAIAAWLGMDPVGPSAFIQAINDRHFDCIVCIVTVSVPPGLAMFFIVRHGAPVRSTMAGGMSALSVSAFAYFGMRLAEPSDQPFHLLIWHGLPVLMLCLVGISAGRKFLRLR